MPELPEVETIRRQIEKKLIGKTVRETSINNPRVIKEPAAQDFKKGIAGKTFIRALRRGKLLVIELAGGWALVIHLKMTGQLVYPGTGKDSRVSFEFSDSTILDFNDTRLFAELRLMRDWRRLNFVDSLGPEPFDVTAEQFKAMLSSRGTKIKVLLMDQTFIAGIGNLYAAEMLFRARIHPARPAKSLSDGEAQRLYDQMRSVLREAIELKGSSVDRYVQLSGKPGDFVSRHAVYDREGKPCSGCPGTVKRITMNGRGTYFCPSCQK